MYNYHTYSASPRFLMEYLSHIMPPQEMLGKTISLNSIQ